MPNPPVILGKYGFMIDPAYARSQVLEAVEHDRQQQINQRGLTQPEKLMDAFCKAYTQRKIDQFFVPDGVNKAADAMLAADNIMIVTGFNVDVDKNNNAIAETDGPPGAAALAISMAKLGKIVTIVSGEANEKGIKDSLNAIDRNLAAKVRVRVFKSTEDAAAQKEAKALLDEVKPGVVLSTEVPAENSEGVPRNMRGKDISPFNEKLSAIAKVANDDPNTTTIGIGDGGNEVGMGGVPGVPQQAMDGSDFASTVPADIPVTAFTSNNGALAIAATAMAKAGRPDEMVTPQQYGDAIRASMAAGLADGVTRGTDPNGKVTKDVGDGRVVINYSGVDGFSVNMNQSFAAIINHIARGDPLPPPYEIKGGPFLVGAFDSSNGGAIAANFMINALQENFGDKVRILPILDHGNAPYGTKDRGTLIKLVVDGLTVADQAKYDAVVMMCNTACTTFKQDSDDEEGIDIAKLKLPVCDLIANTAEEVVKNGGAKPCILSTEATAKSEVYKNKILRAHAKLPDDPENPKPPAPTVYRVGAGNVKNDQGGDWATLVNEMMHVSDDPKIQKYVDAQIKKYVAKIPVDATSIYLCCTHFPVLQDRIEKCLRDRGLNIPVINPVGVQIDAVTAALLENRTDRDNRIQTTTPLVVSSGVDQREKIQESVKKLLGPADFVFSEFNEFKFDLVRPYLYKDDSSSGESGGEGGASTKAKGKKVATRVDTPSLPQVIGKRKGDTEEDEQVERALAESRKTRRTETGNGGGSGGTTGS